MLHLTFEVEGSMEKSSHIFIRSKALVSHAECITTISIIQLCVVFGQT